MNTGAPTAEGANEIATISLGGAERLCFDVEMGDPIPRVLIVAGGSCRLVDPRG